MTGTVGDVRSEAKRVAALSLALAIGACSGGDDPVPSQPGPTAGGSTKVSDALVQMAARVAGAQERGATAEELAALSTPIVRARGDGAVEVGLHATQVAGDSELEDLRRVDVEVVSTVTTPPVAGQPPASVIQAWVPADRLAAVAELAWIASITPPSYGSGDRGG